MPTWKEIYGRCLGDCIRYWVEGDFVRMGRVLEAMEEMVFDDDARDELKEFAEKVEGKYNQQLVQVLKEAEETSNPLTRTKVYSKEDGILERKLKQLLNFHQRLSKKYGLLPPARE